ncbi:MAG: DsbE family thiol:disulfide interchange protein [Pseudomonadota bacterium]
MAAEDTTERVAGTGTKRGGFRPWMLVPAAGALALLAVFALGLGREDSQVLPSALKGKPVPTFSLPSLHDETGTFATADLTGSGVKLVNVWASWCGPCRIEHPFLKTLSQEGVTIHGINYKDDPVAARGFLEELGDPYTEVGVDRKGRVGIEWGVYGVPETFVVDGTGTVVYRHVGPIQGSDIDKKIRPAIAAAQE